MAIHHTDWDDPIRDDELPDEHDLEDGDSPDQIECPSCGAWMLEDAQQCRACGQWVTEWTPATARANGWFWPVMVAVLIAMILVMWHGLGR